MRDDEVRKTIVNSGPAPCPMCAAEVGKPHDEECLKMARALIDKSLRAITGEGCSSEEEPTSVAKRRMAKAGEWLAYIAIASVAVPFGAAWYKIMKDIVEWAVNS